jgi:hypothetical protein
MRRVLATESGGDLYSRRQGMIEPVFAQIKQNRRAGRFKRRGRAAVRSEWRLIAATHNLLKLYRHTLAAVIVSFESEGWAPPASLLLDTMIVVEALLPSQPHHAACVALFERAGAGGSTLVFTRLLETELCEVLLNIALREQHGKRWKTTRYDGRPRAGR